MIEKLFMNVSTNILSKCNDKPSAEKQNMLFSKHV